MTVLAHTLLRILRPNLAVEFIESLPVVAYQVTFEGSLILPPNAIGTIKPGFLNFVVLGSAFACILRKEFTPIFVCFYSQVLSHTVFAALSFVTWSLSAPTLFVGITASLNGAGAIAVICVTHPSTGCRLILRFESFSWQG